MGNTAEETKRIQRWEVLSTERKMLQRTGMLPPWYITQGHQLFDSKYKVEGEGNVKGRHRRIAHTLAKHMVGHEAEWEEKFFDLLWNGLLSPATPALANTGTNRGMTVSCSGQYVGDSVEEFYENLKEMALLSKWGFGTSADFSDIRARGDSISRGGTASGPVPVMEDFFTAASKISQGGNRRGAVAAYLDIDHPNWDEAVESLMSNPDGKNYGWTVRDSFVEKLRNGDLEANRKFTRALYVKLVTGKGYFFFVDKANRQRPQMYKDLGLDIKATNLCVAPETLILTKTGHETISDLVNQEVEVWNGSEWSEVTVRQTSENSELVTVTTDSGFELDCTLQHRFYVVEGYSRDGKVVMKEAQELRPGDKLIKLDTPVIEGETQLELPYENGFFSGDGCQVGANARIYLYGEKQNLLGKFPSATDVYVQEKQDRTYFNIPNLQHKFFVPDASYNIESRVQWFAGLLDSDGTLAKNGKSQTLQIASTQEGFLEAVQLMLQTLGVQSKVVFTRAAGKYQLPANDGSGATKEYHCKAVKRLLVNATGILKLSSLGMVTHRVKPSGHVPNRNASQFVTIKEVIYTGRRDATYCFTEPKRNLGVFNGLLTGQCSEIMLHSSEEYTYSCILASMNLAKWDEIKGTDAIFNSAVFLDCLVQDFIDASEGIPGLEKVRNFTIKGRAIGLGAMGFHTYLQSKRIPYGALEAQFLSTEMARTINDEALRASEWLAKEYGEPEWCKGYGVRNTHRTAYAPTKSTALLMGGVSESWSPDPGMVFEMASAVGELRRIPPVFYELMKEKGVYSEETVRDIINHSGSVQHVDWLTDEEKQVFLTAYEVDQRVILRHAKHRQKFTCQGQSLNFFIADEGSEDLVSELMTSIVLDEDILSQYYFYSKSGVVVPDECVACSA